MSLFKKKQKEEDGLERKFDPNEFEIPQIPKTTSIFKTGKKEMFNPTPFISPMFGIDVKDEVVVPKIEDIGADTTRRYDAFREEKDKSISKEELVKQYGHEYVEFDSVILNKEKRKELFGVEYNSVKTEPINTPTIQPEKDVSFSFIKDKTEILTELEDEAPEAPAFKEEKTIEESTLPPIFQEEISNAVVEPNKVEDDFMDKPLEFSIPNDIHSVEGTVDMDAPKGKKDDLSIQNEEDEEEESFIPSSKIETKGFISKEPKPEELVKVEEENYDEYSYPPASIFSKGNEDYSKKEDWIDDQIEIINNTLIQFGIDGMVVNYTKGPTVTRYEIKLAAGVNVRRVTSIEDNFKMNLAASSLTMQAPIPGKPNVGIEVGNKVRETVFFGNLVDCDEFENSSKPLEFAVGKDIEGKNVYFDIAKAPHMLVAGQTGSGKSVCVNTMLVSFLMKNRPDQLKLMLIDPKQVEMAFYNDLPHLITPVIGNPKQAALGLQWAVDEMERRYQAFLKTRTKEIKSHNEVLKLHPIPGMKPLPYIVIVIDELANLMQYSGPETELAINALTAKSRASGIHLVVATQRPTKEVVSGNIKANIPTRFAFKVASHIDSQTILDTPGAEQLLGRGDLLIRKLDNTVRCQCALIEDEEIIACVDYIKKQYPAHYLFTTDNLGPQLDSSKKYEDWEIICDVAKFVVANHTASINRITKQFGMGFNRCQDIVNSLESLNIVGPNVGSKAREVLVTDEQLEEILGKNQ